MKIKLLTLEELNFVQIVCLEQGKSFELCSEKSRYLHGEIFSLFQHCFELSSADFYYYSLSSFNTTQVVTLRNHLLTNQSGIIAITNADELERFILRQVPGIEFVNVLKDINPEWKISWEKTRDQLLQVGEDLIEIIDTCIDEDLFLWIKGF